MPARFPKGVPVPRLKLTRVKEVKSADGTSWYVYYKTTGSVARARRAEGKALQAAGFERNAETYLKGHCFVVLV